MTKSPKESEVAGKKAFSTSGLSGMQKKKIIKPLRFYGRRPAKILA
jgi:hypothetical protein